MIELNNGRADLDRLKIAVIHDWFTVYSGAERVVEQILNIFPHADLFAQVDFLPDDLRGFIKNKKVTTSFIQKLPFAKTRYREYLPLMPLAVEQFDMSGYDLVISSNHAVAKGVITGPDQVHISYVHSPMRYAWDLTHQYLKESGLDRGLKGWIAKILLHRIRIWDYRTASGVDEFIANSQFIARRIRKVYGRDASVIHPPVSTDGFELQNQKEDFYFAASRMVPYKKMDLIVEAFSQMPQRKLVVIGGGPSFENARRKAGPNIELLGFQPNDVLKQMMRRARAFVFAAEEDFGIIPVEAQACGTPVIAFGRGGSRETVIENETGIFFEEQTAASIIDAVDRFEKIEKTFRPERICEQARLFSVERFKEEFLERVMQIVTAKAKELNTPGHSSRKDDTPRRRMNFLVRGGESRLREDTEEIPSDQSEH